MAGADLGRPGAAAHGRGVEPVIEWNGPPEAPEKVARDLDGFPEIRVLEQPAPRVASLHEDRADVGRVIEQAHGAVAGEEAQGIGLRGSRLVDEAHLQHSVLGNRRNPRRDAPSYGSPGVTEKCSHAAATRPGICSNHSRPPGKALIE